MEQVKITCPKCKKLFSANEELKKILREPITSFFSIGALTGPS